MEMTFKIRPENKKEAAWTRASGRAFQVEVTARLKSLVCSRNR